MKHKFTILIFKFLSVVFILSSIISFIITIIYNVKKGEQDIIFYIFTNLSVTLFYRTAMGVFFLVFAKFIEEWLKIDGEE